MTYLDFFLQAASNQEEVDFFLSKIIASGEGVRDLPSSPSPTLALKILKKTDVATASAIAKVADDLKVFEVLFKDKRKSVKEALMNNPFLPMEFYLPRLAAFSKEYGCNDVASTVRSQSADRQLVIFDKFLNTPDCSSYVAYYAIRSFHFYQSRELFEKSFEYITKNKNAEAFESLVLNGLLHPRTFMSVYEILDFFETRLGKVELLPEGNSLWERSKKRILSSMQLSDFFKKLLEEPVETQRKALGSSVDEIRTFIRRKALEGLTLLTEEDLPELKVLAFNKALRQKLLTQGVQTSEEVKSFFEIKPALRTSEVAWSEEAALLAFERLADPMNRKSSELDALIEYVHSDEGKAKVVTLLPKHFYSWDKLKDYDHNSLEPYLDKVVLNRLLNQNITALSRENALYQLKLSQGVTDKLVKLPLEHWAVNLKAIFPHLTEEGMLEVISNFSSPLRLSDISFVGEVFGLSNAYSPDDKELTKHSLKVRLKALHSILPLAGSTSHTFGSTEVNKVRSIFRGLTQATSEEFLKEISDREKDFLYALAQGAPGNEVIDKWFVASAPARRVVSMVTYQPYVHSVFKERFGSDFEKWETVIGLLPSWEGTVNELVESVDLLK